MENYLKGTTPGRLTATEVMMKDRNRNPSEQVKIITEFDSKHIFGELVYFPYQWALGISVRHLECDGMGWMFRFYFGPFKIWFNLK